MPTSRARTNSRENVADAGRNGTGIRVLAGQRIATGAIAETARISAAGNVPEAIDGRRAEMGNVLVKTVARRKRLLLCHRWRFGLSRMQPLSKA